MADTSNLSNFLTDVANSIRNKKGTTEEIPAANFDTEIASIETGVDTSDATATVDDILNTGTAYIATGKVTGGIIATVTSSGSPEEVETNKQFIIKDSEGNILTENSYGCHLLDYDYNNGYCLLDVINMIDGVRQPTKLIIAKEQEDKTFLAMDIFSGNEDISFGFDRDVSSGKILVYNNEIYVFYSMASERTSEETYSYTYQFCCNKYSLDFTQKLYKHIYDTGPYNTYGNFIMNNPNTLYCSYSASVYKLTLDDNLNYISSSTVYSANRTGYFRISNNGNYLLTVLQQHYYDRETRIINLINGNVVSLGTLSSYCDVVFLSDDVVAAIHNDGKIVFYNCADGSVIHEMKSELIKSFNLTRNWSYEYNVKFSVGNNVYIIKDTHGNTYPFYQISIDLETYEVSLVKTIQDVSGGLEFDNTHTGFVMYGVNMRYILSSNAYRNIIRFNETIKNISCLNRNGIDYFVTTKANSVSSDILSGKTAFNGSGKLIGTMPNNGELNITPSTEEQTIPTGYTSGGTVSGDAELLPENIKQGVNIFGVDGAFNETFLGSIPYIDILSQYSDNYGFKLNDNNYYESQNKGHNSSYSLCKFVFEVIQPGNITFDVINSGESTCDYGIFSKIDTTLSANNSDDSSSNVQRSFYRSFFNRCSKINLC